MSTPSTPDRELADELWTYISRRPGVKSKLVELWLDAEGNELVFGIGKGAASRSVGATYTVGVDRDDEGTFRGAALQGARFAEAGDPDDERVARWVALDRAAQTEDAARRRAERAKRDAGERFGELTLNDVRGLLANAGPQRYALLANVLRHIGA